MIAFDGGQSFARERLLLADPDRGACVQEQRQLRGHFRCAPVPSSYAASPHSGSAGCVRSTPSAIVSVPFIQPIKGWRSLVVTSIDGAPVSRDGSERTRRKATRRPFMSTSSLSKPASFQALVMTLFCALLLHHAR